MLQLSRQADAPVQLVQHGLGGLELGQHGQGLQVLQVLVHVRHLQCFISLLWISVTMGDIR